MSFLSSLGAEAKALARLTGPTNLWTRFNSYGGVYGNGSYGGVSYGAPSSGVGALLVNQSSQLDYSALLSDPLSNSVVALCVEKIATALRTAPMILEQRTDNGWQRVDNHPALDLLQSPNEDLSDVDVWGLTTAFKRTRGEAFWYIVPNRAGLPGEIYVWPRERIEVVGDENHFIAGYRVQTESGEWIPLVDKHQIIHFRHLPNPYNARLGWTALHTGRAQMAGDNLSATYHTAILSNAGVVSLLISLKDGLQNGQVNPDQFQQVVNNIRRAGRERAGSVEGLNVPLEVHKLAYSPDEMGLEKLIDYYEGRLCALMGVDPMVAGLPAGDGRKTYSNLSEALNDFWERTLIPDRDADCATLNRQYLPLFGLDKREWRLRADYSNVPALQENQDEIHTRIREDYKAGIPDLYTVSLALGYPADDSLKGVRYGSTRPGTPQTVAKAATLKSLEDFLKAFNENEPRDERGRWTSIGIGVRIEPSTERVSKGKKKPVTVNHKLTKQEKGALGENIVAAWLREHRARDVEERYGRTNYAIDILHCRSDGKFEGLEIKTSSIDASSRYWMLTFGTSKTDKESLKELTREQKKEFYAGKQQDIIERKQQALEELRKEKNDPSIQLKTITVMLDPDRKLADIYVFDGIHKRITIADSESAYQATFSYEIINPEAVSPHRSRKDWDGWEEDWEEDED